MARVLAVLLLAVVSASCGSRRVTRTQRGEPRIVTAGGAVTEIVFALGEGGRLVGVDSSSVYPEEATRLPQCGYQRALSAEPVLSLSPSHVFASAEAGPPAALEQLRRTGVAVSVLPGEYSIDGAAARIEAVARALHREARGAELVRALREDAARVGAPASPPVRVMFVMARGAGAVTVSGRGTAADAMIRLAGGVNAIEGFEGYRPLTAEAAVGAAPDLVLLTTRGLAGIGGIDALLALPGLSLTPAGRARRVLTLDDLYLLGFGPRTGRALQELASGLRAARTATQAGLSGATP